MPGVTLRAALPFAGRTVIALDPARFAAIRQVVAALDRIAHTPAYTGEVDDGADPLVRFEPGNRGVFMGYDFHLSPDGPRLIEINTNAGGALLNGLHTAALCDPDRLACLCTDLLPVETMQQRIVGMFEAELHAVRGPDARLRRVAIADESPRTQFLYPEFELFVELFARAGIEAEIVDTASARRGPWLRPGLPARHRLHVRHAAHGARCARPIWRARWWSRPRRASTICWRTNAGLRCSPRRTRWLGSACPQTKRAS